MARHGKSWKGKVRHGEASRRTARQRKAWKGNGRVGRKERTRKKEKGRSNGKKQRKAVMVRKGREKKWKKMKQK